MLGFSAEQSHRDQRYAHVRNIETVNMASLSISEMISSRGTVMKVIDGYKLAFGCNLANGWRKYRCINNRCAAFAKFNEDGDIMVRDSLLAHNHEGYDGSVLLRQKVSNSLKRKAVDAINVRPSKLLDAAKDDFDVKDMTKTDIEYVRRVVHRARSNRRDVDPTQRTIQPSGPSRRPKSPPCSSSENQKSVEKRNVPRQGSRKSIRKLKVCPCQ